MRGVLARGLAVCGVLAVLAVGSEAQTPENGSRPDVLLRRDVAVAIPQLNRTISVRLQGASLDEALRTVAHEAGLPLTYNDAILPPHMRVWLTATDIRADDALEQILRDSGLQLLPLSSGQVVVVKARAGGSVSGRVTEVRTGHPVIGASVMLAGARWHTTTGDDGRFRLEEVTAGTYTLTVRRIGYVTGSASVAVAAGQEVAVDLRLDVSASPLDAVVVTGTIAPTEQKALANPISVITGAMIQQRGITKINDLFRGDIPGVFAPDYGTSSASVGAPVYVRGATELFDVPTLKTYIDGVEIANSEFLNEIDPTMIDHVEIVRGPEAATLYGAQAINGVMQVFTKKGSLAAAPHLTVSVGAGSLESPYGTGIRHDDNVSLSGGTADLSYNVGGTYEHDGPWTPDYHRDVYSGYASLSIQPSASPLRVDLTARFGQQNTRSGRPQTLARAILDGTLALAPGDVVPHASTLLLPQQTLGATVHYTPRSNWQHTLTLGLDRGANGGNWLSQPAFTTPSDSFADVVSEHTARATLAYNSAVDLRLSERVTANMIVGVDHWDYQADGFTDQGTTTDVGTLGSGGPILAERRRDHNTGLFGQTRIGVADALFLTAGVRVDQGPALPEDRHHRSVNPRIGASYAFAVGPFRGKLRAEYGSALKPADPGLKAAAQITPTYIQLASPNLLPERQTGWDGGVELYAGDRASLSVTRYDQIARDLIYVNFVAFSPVFEQQFVNVARVKNSGWELEGTLRLVEGLNARATYSETESIVQALAPNDLTGLAVGQALPGVPHHLGALTLSELTGRLFVEGAVSYVGASSNYDPVAAYRAASPRLGTPDFGSGLVTLPAAYRVGVCAGYDLTPRLALWARGENLLNRIVLDQGFLPVDQVGRILIAGVRVH
jgi:outer membrane receptor protein involved in Fe transport